MLQVERTLQLFFGLMCCTSGLLLGFSQQDWTLAIIAFFSVVFGWILTDWLKWVVISSWVANFLSIAVLVMAMQDFFNSDSGSQLLAVANLLVYLQLVLLFQKKSPRLYWQVSVLSLLQVVVATIFNLRFEGGLFFVLYMVFAATALALLTIYDQGWNAKRQGRVANRKMNAELNRTSVFAASATPLAVFDQTVTDNRILRRMIKHLVFWVGVSMFFAAILFYKIPRSDSAWFGSKFIKTSGTGVAQSLELNERGVIRQNSKVVMRVRFTKPGADDGFRLVRAPYFRGLALSDIRIEDGITAFKAPYDRVYGYVYEGLDPRWYGSRIQMDVTLEPTADAMLYGCMPAYRSNKKGHNDIEFCHELSALTRRRQGAQIELAPYSYSLVTPTNFPASLPRCWPYKPEAPVPSANTMRGNRGQWEWLTQIDRDRYPGLVKIADQIAERAKDPSDFYRLAQALSLSFNPANKYSYTLDFTRVKRDTSLDPIEDFVVNHKTGHCSLYAAGLCLMLRSQGIPARVVVGFYGGNYSKRTGEYVVTGKHAHSWVEAYIPPEDCGPIEKYNERVLRTGAWLTLDATPQNPYEFSTSEDAIDLARTFWQGYVLGLDEQQQSTDWLSEDSELLGLFDMQNWGGRLSEAAEEYRENPIWKLIVAVLVLAVLITIFINTFRKEAKRRRATAKPASRIRRLVGRAVSLIAPGLGTWLMHGDHPSIPFYDKLLATLERHGHHRLATQTHREFAEHIVDCYRDHEESSFIQKVVTQTTERFNEVRFGETGPPSTNDREIESDLKNLRTIIASDPNWPASQGSALSTTETN